MAKAGSKRVHRQFASSITAKEFRLIGELATVSAHIDTWLEFMIWKMLGVDESVGRILTDNIYLGTKITLAKKLIAVRSKNEKLRKAFQPIHDKLANTNAVRTAAIHGIWRQKDKAGLVIGPHASYTKSSGSRIVKSSDLIGALSDHHAVLVDLMIFWGDHRDVLAP